MAKERLFFTGSTRIISDPRPSGLDMRVYACVSLHDGMSLVKGTGRGCYATFATLTAEIGCDSANLSRSLKRLVDWGYLTEERQTDRRRKAFRVTFHSVESWQDRQRLTASQLVKIVGNGLSGNGRSPPQTDTHYSSLKGLDLPKDKLNSSEEARFAARRLFRIDGADNVGAQLAMLEHALDAGESFDRLDAFEQLGNVFTSSQPESIGHWALRLSDKLVESMTPAEHAQWQARYGCGEAA